MELGFNLIKAFDLEEQIYSVSCNGFWLFTIVSNVLHLYGVRDVENMINETYNLNPLYFYASY